MSSQHRRSRGNAALLNGVCPAHLGLRRIDQPDDPKVIRILNVVTEVEDQILRRELGLEFLTQSLFPLIPIDLTPGAVRLGHFPIEDLKLVNAYALLVITSESI